MPKWGDTLRVLRNAQHLSQRALAAKAGVSPDTIYRAEKSGEPTLQGSTYEAIAKALGTRPFDIDQMWKGQTLTVPVDDARSSGERPGLPPEFFGAFELDAMDVYVERYNGLGLPGINEGDLLIFSRSMKAAAGMVAAVLLVADSGVEQKYIGVIRNGADGRLEVHQSVPGLIVYAPPMELASIHPAIICLKPRRIDAVDRTVRLGIQVPSVTKPKKRKPNRHAKSP